MFGDYAFVKPLALFFACGVGTIASLPFDYVKTRLMQMHSDPLKNRITTYGMIDTLSSIFLIEGTTWAPWAGFFTAFTQNLITLALVVYITSGITKSIKRKKGL